MNKKEYELFSKIKFTKRYERLSEDFRTENELDYTNEQVINIIEELGYKAKFVKRNNFFTVELIESNIKFYLNINLKYSIAELIIGATNLQSDTFITGGPFGGLYKDLKYEEQQEIIDSILKPAFENYSQLKEILEEALSIYHDFKQEILKYYKD